MGGACRAGFGQGMRKKMVTAIEVNVTRSTNHQLQQWQRKDRNLFRAIAKLGFDSAHPCGAPNVAETSIYGDTMHM